MDDDDDRETFLQAEGLPALSMPAFQLHHFALTESFQRGTPGFIPDDYLESIAAETTLTAVELETAGLWLRRDSGYFVNDADTIRMMLTFREGSDANAAKCLARGHHLPSEDDNDDDWIICQTCHVPLKRPDGKPVGGENGEPPDYGPRHDDLTTD